MKNKKQLYKHYYDRTTSRRDYFQAGDNVVVKEKKKQWSPVVNKLQEPRPYIVEKGNGDKVRRNSFHLRPSLNEPMIRPNGVPEDRPMTNLSNLRGKETLNYSSETLPHVTPTHIQAKSKRLVKVPLYFKDFEMY
ncbi:unnamed protein product [Ceutorhynchus assimilis]|uniref:Uncharacterized protein n=1 Tax=Ceutorhynchus assimilis TaxID=467358 RepID=A0A9N9MFB1_9CUCU|nr:unnamed protein product [Ceutorhynchus assimilis]